MLSVTSHKLDCITEQVSVHNTAITSALIQPNVINERFNSAVMITPVRNAAGDQTAGRLLPFIQKQFYCAFVNNSASLHKTHNNLKTNQG